MPRSDAAIVKAVLDEQLAAKKLVAKAVADTEDTAQRITAAVRKVMVNRAMGRINQTQGKKALKQIWLMLMLGEYVKWVPEIKALGDKSVTDQLAAISGYGAPLSTVAQIRNIDVQTHAAEQKGLGDGSQGTGETSTPTKPNQ